jgi:hypothetical protein
MELDELKTAWQSLEQRLQRVETLRLAEGYDRRARAVHTSLRPLAIGQSVQIAFGIAMIIVGVALWSSFKTIVPVFVSGLVLHVYGVVTIIAAGVVLGGIARIDRSLPVVALQRRLAKLRRAYVVSGMIVGLPWWVLWTVAPIVVASLAAAGHGSVDPNVGLWLGTSVAFGVGGLVATWALHRWARRPGREAFAQRFDDAAAGSSLRRAQAELDALQLFVKEGG